MKKWFVNLTKEQQKKIEKYFLIAVTALSALMVALLLFVPFCLYEDSGFNRPTTKRLLPIQAFSLLDDITHRSTGVAYLDLGVFIFLAVCLLIAAVMVIRSVVAFLSDGAKALNTTKHLLVFSTVVSAFYFIAGIIVCVITKGEDGILHTAANFYPAVILLIADVAYAILIGLRKKQQSQEWEAGEWEEESKEKIRKDRKEIYKARLELFVFVGFLAVLAIFTLLSNIVTVSYEEETLVKLSGWSLLRNSLNVQDGEAIIGFIVFILLILVITTLFLSLVAFLGQSDLFYKISISSVAVSVISLFLVGMFGKYYQMVQKLNEGLLAKLLYEKLSLPLTDVEMLAYKIKSASLYYFFVSVAAIAVLLLRNPYTKGIAIERELALQRQSEKPHTIKGDVALTDIPDNAVHRNDGTILSSNQGGEQTVWFADPCPIFTELDAKIPQFRKELEEKRQALFDDPTLPKLVQYVVQYARDSRLHLSYTEEDIATFVAGLGATKLSILQGMSGTGKTSLPKIFSEALHARCDVIEVESSWRDKNELLGYYNEFSKSYTPKKFTQALYRAKLNPETLTFIVLDEMNLSRIEYYFSDFLSLMENEPDKRDLRLVNVALYRTVKGEKAAYKGLFEGHTLKVPSNVWFIGTANRDESTFEISDKVYDRAHTMNFNKRAAKISHYNEPIPQRFLPVDVLQTLFENAKRAVQFNVDAYPVIAEVERLLAPYNISFGNRIALQIENFVNVYASCFASSSNVIPYAVEQILLSKVVSKLELKSVENKEQLAAEFERLNLHKCSEFILKLNED